MHVPLNHLSFHSISHQMGVVGLDEINLFQSSAVSITHEFNAALV